MIMRRVKKNRSLSITQNFVFNLIYQILNLLLPLITAPYISRVLGAEKVGIYSYTYAIVSTFVMVGSLGIATHGQKEIAANRENYDQRNRLFWEIFLIRLITVTVSTGIFIIYAISNEQYCIFYIAQLPFLISSILDISWLFQGIERFDYVVIRNLLIKLIGIILIFTLVKNKDDLINYLIILGSSQLLGNMSAWIYAPKFISKPQIILSELKSHIKATLIYFIPTVAYQIYSVLDRVMLGIIIGSEIQNGYYEQAHKIIGILVGVFNAYNIVLRSRMSFYFAKKDYKNIQYHFNNSLHVVSFFAISMSFGLIVIADGFVPWFFGKEYEPVVNILYLFAPMILVMGFAMCIGTHILTPGGMQKWANIAQIIATIINLGGNAILIPKFEAQGAAIASFLSQASVLILYLIFAKTYFNVKSLLSCVLKNITAGSIMLISIWIIFSGKSDGIIMTISQIIMGGIIYIMVLTLLREKLILDGIHLLTNKLR